MKAGTAGSAPPRSTPRWASATRRDRLRITLRPTSTRSATASSANCNRPEWCCRSSGWTASTPQCEGRNGGGDPWHTDGRLAIGVADASAPRARACEQCPGRSDRRDKPGHDKDGIAPYTKPSSRPRTKPVLDIKWIRDNQDAFLKGLTDRGFDDPRATLNRILSLDEERRGTIQKLQEAQARRNAASKEIGQAKAAKDEAPRRGPERGGGAPQDRDPRGRGQRARDREEIPGPARHHSQHARRRCAGRARRRRQCRAAQGRHAEEILRSSRSSISSSARRSG